ncbi:MAG: hypothetical protein MSJ26_09385 [Oscillospiraceae bacterium]|nr:hypothetical protein [Oscillospiraceae bacterium]
MHNLPDSIIDFHTHILPALDDGPADCRTASQMLVKLYEQGVTHAVASSHFYKFEESAEEFIKRRDKAYNELCTYLAAERMTHVPEIILGAEVYFTDELINEPDLERLCIGSTSYILIELPYTRLTKGITDSFREFAACGRVKPILAHLERYAAYADEETLFELLGIAPAQMNCESILSVPACRLAARLLKSGRVAAIGSDCHNMSSRAPVFSEARKKLSRKLGASVFGGLMASSEAILSNKEI